MRTLTLNELDSVSGG
ncbi:bacteriocin, partial [Escherichia coli]|nr:bacteriocin [Salmonella enterica subsp. enterica serovar Kentucky]EFB3778232.1 bacteriocin [Escherichia coli]